MTVIIARKLGERIIVGADTMISDDCAARPDVIPGRLKAIVLTGNFSVAYAGLPDQAIDAIRAAKAVLVESGPVEATEVLRLATKEHEGRIDFLVAVHAPRSELRIIRNGSISDPQDSVALGDANTYEVVRALETVMPPIKVEIDPVYGSVAEFTFQNAFVSLLRDRGTVFPSGVGGLPVLLRATPFGHMYVNHATAVRFAGNDELHGGFGEWKFNLVPSKYRGVAVLGAVVPQASIGYVYNPLTRDEAVPVRLPSNIPEPEKLERFVAAVDQAAEELGGGFEVPP